MKSVNNILIKNCLAIYTAADSERKYREDILIEGNRIKKIEAEITPPENCRIIDAGNCVVVPGFVNTHHHFYQTLTRNIPAVQNAKLFDWLVYLYEIWKFIGEEAIYYSSLLAMMGTIRMSAGSAPAGRCRPPVRPEGRSRGNAGRHDQG